MNKEIFMKKSTDWQLTLILFWRVGYVVSEDLTLFIFKTKTETTRFSEMSAHEGPLLYSSGKSSAG
jgi:hypothetical protein